MVTQITLKTEGPHGLPPIWPMRQPRASASGLAASGAGAAGAAPGPLTGSGDTVAHTGPGLPVGHWQVAPPGIHRPPAGSRVALARRGPDCDCDAAAGACVPY
jgi:hypothetical protein